MILSRRFAAHLGVMVLAVTLATLTFLSPVPASASPSVTTDKEDYAPEDTVIVTGSGYGGGDLLDVVITRPDSTIIRGDGTGTDGWDTVFTNPDGTFTYNYILNGILGSYTIDVYPSPWNGLESFDIPIASTTFTDFTSVSLSINSAAYSTTSLSVTLLVSWSGSGGDPTQIRLANDTSPEGGCGGGVTYGAWQTVTEIGTSNTTSLAWTLLTDAATNPDSGLKRVCIQLAQGSLGSPTNSITANDLIYHRVTNPALGESCGLDMALVIDSSGSIDATELAQMKSAMTSFVSAFLPETPTQMAVIDFDSQATVTQGFTNNETLLNTAINAVASGGFTNWDDAIRDARLLFPNRAANPDVIVFASDGDPTARGGHTDLQHSSTVTTSVSEQNAMSWASAEANAARTSNVRIIGMGIGTAIDTNNLIVVSGPNSHPPNAISSTTDLITSDFSTLAADLATLAAELCGGTITVQKVIDADGNPATTGDQIPGANWTFSTNVDAPDTSTPASGDTDLGGMINFDIDLGVDNAANVDVIEAGEVGFSFVSASCTKPDGPDAGTDPDPVGTPGSMVVNNIPVTQQDIITCKFYNTAITTADVKITSQNVTIPPSGTVGSSFTLTVNKTLHNNGPATPVNVSINPVISGPPDCTITPAGGNPTSATLTMSVASPVTENFNVTCTQPSTHQFTVNNCISITSAGITDPNTANNCAAQAQVSTNILGTSDLKVASVVMSSPASTPINAPFNVSASAGLHNNGTSGPTNADSTFTVNLPPDCSTSSPNPATVQNSSLGISVLANVGPTWSVTCTNPSTHSFTTTTTVAVDQQHVTDPDSLNNSATSAARTTNLLATADVKVSSVSASAPGSTTVGTPFTVTGSAVIHNNGGYGPTSVDSTITLTLPGDCTTSSTNPVVLNNTSLSVSTPVTVPGAPASWSVTCGSPSNHTFSVGASVDVDELHVSDANPGNNSSSQDAPNVVTATSDVKVSSVSVSSPASAGIGAAFNVTASTVLHNNGGYGPANVNTTLTLTLPGDCTTGSTNPVAVNNTSLAVSAPTTVPGAPASWSVTCTSPSAHSFSVAASTSVAQLHVSDGNTGNNSGSNSSNTNVLATSDAKVSSVTVSSPPSASAGSPFNVSASAVIHNNGGYGPANVDTTFTLTLPGDCTTGSANPGTAENSSLATSTPTTVPGAPATWSVTCTNPSAHNFSVAAVASVDQLHVSDPTPGNNTGSNNSTTNILASSDIKVSSVSVSSPASANVGASFTVTGQAVIHNNGGYGPTNVDTTLTLSGPADCTITGANPVAVPNTSLVTSTPASVPAAPASWSVSCTDPSAHSFSVAVATLVDQLHVSDPTPGNDNGSNSSTTNVLGTADVKVSSVSVSAPPTGNIGVPFNVVVNTTLHNNGPQTPANADSVIGLSVPPDCTRSPAGSQTEGNSSLTMSAPVIVTKTWAVTCSSQSSHLFSSTVNTTLDQLHVSDPNTLNNSGGGNATTNVFGDAELKVPSIADVTPTYFTPGVPFTVTINTTLHNNGPITPANADFSVDLTVPGDCTRTPSGAQTADNLSLALSVPNNQSQSWSVTCTNPTVHVLSATSFVTLDMVHVIDPNGANNTATESPITVTPQPATITIIKDAVPDDAQDFSFTCSAPLGSFLLDDDGDGTLSNTNGPVSVPTGTYSCFEAAVSGWVQTSATCSDGSPVTAIDVSPAESVTCTFTNTKNGSITIVKNAVPDDPQDFSFTCSAPLGSFLLDDDGDGTLSNTNGPVSVVPATYGCSEAPVGGWVQTGATCNDGSPVGTINVSPGENVTCTFTNTKGSTITIIKNAVPDDPQDFSFTCSAPLGNFLLDDDGDGTLSNTNGPVSVVPATYGCSEAPVSGWVQTSATCSDGSPVGAINVSAGENVTCTFTNTKNGSVTIIKDAVPNDAQDFSFTCSAPLGNFPLDDDANGTLSNTNGPVSVGPGTYTCSEAAVSGWTPTSATCGDGSPVSAISVSAGENVTCTFTNTKVSSVTIIKDAVPNDPQDFSFGGTCFAAFNLDDDADGTLSNTKTANLAAGPCTVIENAAPAGWSFTSLICSDPDGGTTTSGQTANIDLDFGEAVSCTYTNTKDATVVIVKDTLPNNAQDFSFACSNLGTFQLDDDADGTLPNSQQFSNVTPGTYTCTEANVVGYQITISCTDPDSGSLESPPSATVDVDAGETVTCTFINLGNVPAGPNPVGGIAGLLDEREPPAQAGGSGSAAPWAPLAAGIALTTAAAAWVVARRRLA